MSAFAAETPYDIRQMSTHELRRKLSSCSTYTVNRHLYPVEQMATELDRRAPLMLHHVEVLGRELQRRGLASHVERLRQFYQAFRAGGDTSHSGWSPNHVRLLIALFDLEPHVGDLPKKPPSSLSCTNHAPFTAALIDDRLLLQCSLCDAQWLGG